MTYSSSEQRNPPGAPQQASYASQSESDQVLLGNILFLGKTQIIAYLQENSFNIQDLIELRNVVLFADLHIVKIICGHTTEKEKRKSLLLANCYVKNEKYLQMGEFQYVKPSHEKLRILGEYKDIITEGNVYIPEAIPKGTPFSLLDKRIHENINHHREWGKPINVGEQTFFDTNTGEIASHEAQLLINRIFAPFFPMTRAIRLMNESGENVYVSVDVEGNISGKEISGFYQNVPFEIKFFFRLLYQFLVDDFDRGTSHNISHEGIMYDFNMIWDAPPTKDKIYYFSDIFSKKEFYGVFKEIFFTLKNYIHFYCSEEIARYEKIKDTEGLGSQRGDVSERIITLQRLLNHEKSFTMTNVVASIGIKKKEVLQFAYEADMEHAVGGYASRGVMGKIRGALSVFLGR